MNAQPIAGTNTGVPDYHAWHAVRINTCVAHLGLHLRHMADPPLQCLDLGHDPHMGAQLQELGLTVTGNIHPQHPTVNVPWTLARFDFENPFPFETNTFDVVTAFEVIEHVSGSPKMFLEECWRVLRPGGLLYLATPNVVSWPKVRRLLSHQHPYDAKPYSIEFGPRHPMCHVYEYDPWTLSRLVESIGFQVLDCRTWDVYAADQQGVRNHIFRVLVSVSLAATGFLKDAALVWRRRGHQLALAARKPV